MDALGTNGNQDPDMIFVLKKRGGRKYSEVVLSHLAREVKAGRYSTHDVKGWLIEMGYKDATLNEATNLRYRLLTGKPVKGWSKMDASNKQEIRIMCDFLFNDKLANQVTKDGKETVKRLKGSVSLPSILTCSSK